MSRLPNLYVATLAILVVVASCKSKESLYEEKILKHAGTNKENLLKVINHYRNSDPDSLKLQAAYFLIENIDGMPTLDTSSVEQNEKYFNFLNTIEAPYWKVFSYATRGIDSMLELEKEDPDLPRTKYVDELVNVSPDFLIRNIDSAFHVWRTKPWAKNVSFNDFCEYILPYRCTSTYSENSRNFFLNRYALLPDSLKKETNMFKVGKYVLSDVNSWFVEDVFFLPKYPFLKPIKFSNLLKGRIGACFDANSVRVAALRAMGVATAFDQIPNWGNDNSPHFWYKIIDPIHDTITRKITNVNDSVPTQHIISASTFDVPYFEGTPSSVQINFNRTVPKVYRHCFSIQKNSLAYVAGSEKIPSFFDNTRLKDVTSEYIETGTVNLDISTKLNGHKFVYLCVFDNEEWRAVAWSKVDNGKATFSEVGKNIVYLPAYFDEGEMVPAGMPFLFNLQSDVEPIVPAKTKESVQVTTKFPIRTYVLLWESYMLGGRFQLANRTDLSDTVTIHTINKLPFYETEFPVTDISKYRYLIFQFKRPKDAWGDGWTSEMQFFTTDENGEEIKLVGKPIGNKGEYPNITTKLFDDIFYNVYKPDYGLPERFVGIDLGENNAKRITRVKYMPYTDDNAVKRNETFELFYWDNEWISLGTSKSEKFNHVIFKEVPNGALLLTKNTAGGTQQRPFQFKNNKQVFW